MGGHVFYIFSCAYVVEDPLWHRYLGVVSIHVARERSRAFHLFSTT